MKMKMKMPWNQRTPPLALRGIGTGWTGGSREAVRLATLLVVLVLVLLLLPPHRYLLVVVCKLGE